MTRSLPFRSVRPWLTTAVAWTLASAALADPSAWRQTAPEQPAAVLVRGATVWTVGDAGTLENADLLVVAGRVEAVGKDLEAPAGAVVVDGRGKHVTPGLIDAHSHSAIVGNVNEGTNITTAEVRIADVIDADTINLYWQLAGGVTTIHLLHGSANSIGGQNAVIKLRWGATPDELLFAEAPQGIKFALGENPKQSNWNVQERRYPQTRQGVEQSIRERLLAALDYRRQWQEYRDSGKAAGLVPPRRDLQLDALLEILDGERLVHAHSYRADEILMLIDLAESFGFRVSSFQHVNEGYKVADEIAAHGGGASTFSDWWAYKYEVVDSVPHNGTLMWRRGVVTSFNSDDDELARRLNLEAAKAVRYGGMPEADALALVTLNPAIQLGIDQWVGSLEPGKHGDFVVWSGHPLSTFSLCEQTWVDGRKYFDRAEDLARRQRLAAERDELIAAVKAAKASDPEAESEDGGEETAEPPAEDPVPEPPRRQGHSHSHGDPEESSP